MPVLPDRISAEDSVLTSCRPFPLLGTFLSQAAVRHDEKLAGVVLRLAAVEREAESAAASARQQHSRRVSELEAEKISMERRGLSLAQGVAAKQVRG